MLPAHTPCRLPASLPPASLPAPGAAAHLCGARRARVVLPAHGAGAQGRLPGGHTAAGAGPGAPVPRLPAGWALLHDVVAAPPCMKLAAAMPLACPAPLSLLPLFTRQVLMTREMRARLRGGAPRPEAAFATVKVRFPEGISLQVGGGPQGGLCSGGAPMRIQLQTSSRQVGVVPPPQQFLTCPNRRPPLSAAGRVCAWGAGGRGVCVGGRLPERPAAHVRACAAQPAAAGGPRPVRWAQGRDGEGGGATGHACGQGTGRESSAWARPDPP